jgi:nucleolar protein 56
VLYCCSYRLLPRYVIRASHCCASANFSRGFNSNYQHDTNSFVLDYPTTKFGEKLKEQVEERLKFYETGVAPQKNVDVMKSAIEAVKAETDKMQVDGENGGSEKKNKKRKKPEGDDEEEEKKEKKKAKKDKKEKRKSKSKNE